jgi:hypothetical protein
MKWILNILGLLLFLMGFVWILQGLGLYPVGFMAHQVKWAYYGMIAIVVALGFFILANWRKKRLPPNP